METNFKGTKGEVFIGENQCTVISGELCLVGRFFDGKGNALLENRKQSDEIVLANTELFRDALNIRQQINCDLPGLLERYNEMLQMLIELELIMDKDLNPTDMHSKIQD